MQMNQMGYMGGVPGGGRGAGRGRGGYRGGAGGGFPPQMMGGAPMMAGSSNPAAVRDTLRVEITDVQHPVTTEILQQVFRDVAPVVACFIDEKNSSPDRVVSYVRFQDPESAYKGYVERNHRQIYSNCLNMEIVQVSWPQPLEGMMGAGVLGSPQHQQAQAQAQAQGRFPGGMMPHQHQRPQQGMMPPPPHMMGMQGVPAGMVPMYGAPHGRGMGPRQFHQPQQWGPGGMAPMAGGRGRGRGGAMGIPSYSAATGMMDGTGGSGASAGPTQFVSVAKLPLTEPLHTLFILMEAYGGVVSLRRNQRNPEIITGHMASSADAEAVCKYLRHAPIGGGLVSSRPFPGYNERHPPTAEGDPRNPEVKVYDFSQAAHRAPQYRSHVAPTAELIVMGCAQKAESDLMMYFSEKNLFPESVTKNEDDGTFLLKMDSTANAVKLLIECQNNVCGNEKANIVFTGTPEQHHHNNNNNNNNNTNNNNNNNNNNQQQQQQVNTAGGASGEVTGTPMSE